MSTGDVLPALLVYPLPGTGCPPVDSFGGATFRHPSSSPVSAAGVSRTRTRAHASACAWYNHHRRKHITEWEGGAKRIASRIAEERVAHERIPEHSIAAVTMTMVRPGVEREVWVVELVKREVGVIELVVMLVIVIVVVV